MIYHPAPCYNFPFRFFVPRSGRAGCKGFFFLLALIALIMLGQPSSALAKTDIFTIEDVRVDVTAKSAAQAREQAFAKAQEEAFSVLAHQLLSLERGEEFILPDQRVISSLIKDFEITEEQLSSVRYIGNYTFRFDGEAVRRYFSGHGLSYTDVSRKPVLVLPYYQSGNRAVLWGGNNPWLAAWANKKSYRGLVPVVVPIGDLEDVSDLGGDENMLSYDPQGLARMVQRYGAGDALVLLAVPLWRAAPAAREPDALDILIYRTDLSQPELVQRLQVQADANEKETIFAQAAREAHKALQQDWKEQTMVDPAQDNRLKVRVRYDNMKEWIETEQALRRVRGITDVKIKSLTPQEAELELGFQGSERRLRLALAQGDMVLTTPQIDFSRGYSYSPLLYELYLEKYKPAARY